jgi:hypothetical protein
LVVKEAMDPSQAMVPATPDDIGETKRGSGSYAEPSTSISVVVVDDFSQPNTSTNVYQSSIPSLPLPSATTSSTKRPHPLLATSAKPKKKRAKKTTQSSTKSKHNSQLRGSGKGKSKSKPKSSNIQGSATNGTSIVRSRSGGLNGNHNSSSDGTSVNGSRQMTLVPSGSVATPHKRKQQEAEV